MKEDLDILLDLAVDVEVLGDSLADVDLTSPEDEELAAKDPLQAGGAAEPSSKCGAAAGAPVSTVSSASSASAIEGMSTLRNTTWDKDLGGEDTTEVRRFLFFPFFWRGSVRCSVLSVQC